MIKDIKTFSLGVFGARQLDLFFDTQYKRKEDTHLGSDDDNNVKEFVCTDSVAGVKYQDN